MLSHFQIPYKILNFFIKILNFSFKLSYFFLISVLQNHFCNLQNANLGLQICILSEREQITNLKNGKSNLNRPENKT